MTLERLLLLLQQKEGLHLEFKEAKFSLPESIFETICAMLNSEGGDIILGVNDSGSIVGVETSQVDKMVKDLVSLSNNSTKISPTFLLSPRKYEVNRKWVIHVQIPTGSQVHKTSKVIFSRSSDGDFRITEAPQIAEIFNRKRTHYTENTVYPALRFEDFNSTLFPKIRNLIRSNNADHPWLALNDQQLLETAGLRKRDFLNGQEGYTLAAALLLGKDEVITQILPHYKIDALVRVHDVSRYDDRMYIQTNLIEAYEQLMNFVEKHLPDKFFLQGDQRINLRTAIFREVAANIIVHREYTNAIPCTFVIGKSYVETENANNPHGEGMINPDRFAPFPKNPVIAKFFIQLGRVDELGSGVLNVTRFTKPYVGRRKPEFMEGATFRIKIPIPINKREGAGDGVNEGINDGANEGVNTMPDNNANGVSNHPYNAPYNALSNTSVNRGLNTTANSIICNGKVVSSLIIETVDRLMENGISDGESDEQTHANRIELIQVVAIVVDKDGQKAKEIALKLNKSISSVERYIRKARALNILRFVGPSKTGGYQTTEYFENRLTKND